MKPSLPFAPLAAFYFCYFAFFGLFSPFWGLYLESLSFSAWQISLLMSLSTLARIAAPGLWGWLADHLRRRRPIVIGTSIVSAAAFAMVGLSPVFWWMFAFLALSHFFWAAALPLVEASSAHLTRATPGRYSRIRLWGSVGFVVTSVAGGYLFDWLSIAIMPWVVTATLVLIVFAALAVPDVVPERATDSPGPIMATLRQPVVLALFACCFLMAYAHGPYYVFYSIALKNAGYARDSIGWLWAIGVMAEVAAFWFMPRLMRSASAERLMRVSLLAAVARFALLALALETAALAVLAQLLHGLTFGVHHAAAVALLHRYFAPAHQARAQGFYIIAGFGLGGSSGGLISGLLWPMGGALAVFGMSTLAALGGVILALLFLRSVKQSAAV
ncbi:MFS transporter [Craterilacuibacter sinensis]|uniref:MFS transporter n=1 Tax=Craterilacuibacter sinensis TaxID=2686017 RepID=A0A845BJD7_9NEIS|nr:MFS transporter [Craterilacuibacter sinensis]MXR36312.1 MFS transporter [Craterilacuibacter sinensis]